MCASSSIPALHHLHRYFVMSISTLCLLLFVDVVLLRASMHQILSPGDRPRSVHIQSLLILLRNIVMIALPLFYFSICFSIFFRCSSLTLLLLVLVTSNHSIRSPLSESIPSPIARAMGSSLFFICSLAFFLLSIAILIKLGMFPPCL